MKKNKFVLLDLFRGMAAILVFIGHLRSLMFVDYDGGGILKKFFYASTSLGHEAVIIFFVLSGFFITRSILYKLDNNSWSWQGYITDRTFRILVVLIPAVIITFIIDKIGVYYFGGTALYMGSTGSTVIVEPIIYNLYLINAISNILLIPTEIVNATGSNASLWSISYEFWSYMLFPLILLCLVGSYNNKIKLLFIFFIFFIFILLGWKGLFYFSIWFFGGFAAFIHNNSLIKSNFLIPSGVAVSQFFIVLMFSLLGMIHDFILAFSFFILLIFYAEHQVKSQFIKRFSEYFAKMSYTLYAIHLPLIVIFLASLFSDFSLRLPFSMKNLLYFLLITTLIITVANIVWYVFERNTDKLKGWFVSVR